MAHCELLRAHVRNNAAPPEFAQHGHYTGRGMGSGASRAGRAALRNALQSSAGQVLPGRSSTKELGVRLEHDGAAFSTAAQLNQVSDFISEGDIQMTGDGTPYVLLADCQTIGGYPRIGTVLPADLPRIAQAGPGAELRFQLVTLEEAEAAWQSDADWLADLSRACAPRVRNPREMADLLSYELIDRPPDEVAGG